MFNAKADNKKFAEEFNKKNKTLVKDLYLVYNHFQELLKRKKEILSTIHLQANLAVSKSQNKSILMKQLRDLDKLLRLEYRYLRFVYYKLDKFHKEIKKILNDCKRITDRKYGDYIPLTAEYLLSIYALLEKSKKALKISLKINSRQIDYVRYSIEKTDKDKFPAKFMQKFYSFYDKYVGKESPEDMIEQIKGQREHMHELKPRVIDSWNASKNTLKWSMIPSSAALSLMIVMSNPAHELASIFLALSTIYLVKNPQIVKEYFRN